MARMRYDIELAPEAVEDFDNLDANVRAAVRDAIEQHLRHEPTKVSQSRIKRFRGLSRPQYRLRIGDDIRVFYDVTEDTVQVLAIVALSEIKDDLSKYLRMAENEEIVITRHGKPAGLLVGFASEDDWFDYRLENDPRFLTRISQARRSLEAGKGIRLEDLPTASKPPRRRPKR